MSNICGGGRDLCVLCAEEGRGGGVVAESMVMMTGERFCT